MAAEVYRKLHSFASPSWLLIDAPRQNPDFPGTTMQIYIGKNGQQLGPFTEEQVRQRLATGEFSATDLAWQEGASNWRPVGEMIFTASSAPAKAPGIAKASFIIGLVTGPFWLLVVGIAAFLVMANKPTTDPAMVLAGLGMFALLFVNIAGIILAAVGFRQRNGNWASWWGLGLNVAQILLIIGLWILGTVGGRE